ncbi:MAG: hypothetical protein NTX03_13850 [Bacteroidetes bacterium]|nr:hypothetical protein [Bacteroidota bacterium]
MKRKDFIKTIGVTGAGMLIAPYILPSGRLFAATGSRVVNHVVLCLFAGGVRSLESVQKAEGNLMPNLFAGSEAISKDIAPVIGQLPTLSSTPLSNYGTLYKNFRYNSMLAGHFQGNTVALTGAYTDNYTTFDDFTPKPSIFEFYRKHNSPSQTAKNDWWISNSSGENEFLSHSSDPAYGAKYGANFLCPNVFMINGSYKAVDLCRTFAPAEITSMDSMRNYLNSNFNKSLQNGANFTNTEADKVAINAFMDALMDDANNGKLNDPWGFRMMSGDMYNIFFAEKVIKEFKPELTVVNMTDVDICHFNFSQYCDNLHKADYAAAHLWQTIQNTPGMKDDTIMIVVPEHGRDNAHNSIMDAQGRKAIDHGGDVGSKEIFCLVLGPNGKIKQNNVINSVEGESIDLVPTIAHILGFLPDIPSTYLKGKVLTSAFA